MKPCHLIVKDFGKHGTSKDFWAVLSGKKAGIPLTVTTMELNKYSSNWTWKFTLKYDLLNQQMSVAFLYSRGLSKD